MTYSNQHLFKNLDSILLDVHITELQQSIDYSDRQLSVMDTTRQLGKYLKAHSRSSAHMSNDDHLLVPIVNIVRDCQYTQENIICLSNVAGMDLNDLANHANQTEECNSRSPIKLYL